MNSRQSVTSKSSRKTLNHRLKLTQKTPPHSKPLFLVGQNMRTNMQFIRKLEIDKTLAVDSVARYLNFWQVWHRNWDNQDIALIHCVFRRKF